MPTQEERIAALEKTIAGYRPVLQNVAYELTMVKGLTVDQIEISQELRQDMKDIKERLTRTEERLTCIEGQLDTILTLLKPS